MERREFDYGGLRLVLYDGVYVPSDDTMLLAETLRVPPGARVLDMCTGSGLLGLLAARRGARRVVLADDDPLALRCASENAERNGLKNAEVVRSDLFQKVQGRFDLILFNPPYLPQENSEDLYLYDEKFEKWRNIGIHAWDGGPDGRRLIDRFLREYPPHLAPGGRIHMIGSSLSDYEKTRRILKAQGMEVKILGRQRFFFEEIVAMGARRGRGR
ncbi:MAG: methyltransferase [Euryarchaeota archaeon]|nr:methyltransferase [Euryarchaeota archaeon]